jgi:hypothetical protein
MGDILRFTRHIGGSLEPEVTSVLGNVFDDAMSSIQGCQPDAVKEVIAVRIMTLALLGERNPDRLRAAALRGVAPASHISLGR